MPSSQEIHTISQKLVDGLEGAAPCIQVERRCSAGAGGRVVELEAMGVGTHMEAAPRTNELKYDEKCTVD